MTEAEVVACARSVAEAAGESLDRYEAPKVTRDQGVWRVDFWLRPPGRPGGHFAVEVSDETRTGRLILGR
jgi:hypothetical protein